MFGKANVGKSTIFKLFVDPLNRHLDQGGNLAYDYRTYYARCWILPCRWEHSMVFLNDPKFDMRWQSLDINYLRKVFEPTNILVIVSDSTQEDIDSITRTLKIYPKIKPNLITFLIANMQDRNSVLRPKEIQNITGLSDILGISAIANEAKTKIEDFFEEAVKRYFLLLSKRWES